jgi:hypothetical protein
MRKSMSSKAGLLCAVLLASACGNGNSGNQTNDTDTTGSNATFASSVSACGGFGQGTHLFSGYRPYDYDSSTEGYCAAEVVEWLYDGQSMALTVVHKRVVLNCCGDHFVEVTSQTGGYLITEVDNGLDNGGTNRCNCDCIFDYATEIHQVAQGVVQLSVQSKVIDLQTVTTAVMNQPIDFSSGKGKVVISATALSDSTYPQCPVLY